MFNRGQSENRRSRELWALWSLLPLGFGSWAPIVAGIRYRDRRWVAIGIGWVLFTVLGLVLSGVERRGHDGAAGLVLLIAWGGSITSSFVIRNTIRTWELQAPPGGIPQPRPTAPWPVPTERSRQWTAIYALRAFAAAFAAIVVLALLLRHVFNIHLEIWLGVIIVDVILLTALVPLARRRGLSPADLGIRPTRALPSLGYAFLGLIAYAVFGVIWIALFINHESRNGTAAEFAQVKHLGTLEVIVTVFAIAICAPVVEEIFFRGLVYRSFRNRFPIWSAALMAGVLFGLAHITGYPLVTLPVKAAFGVIACLLYERTGSLLPGIGLHSFVDASVVDIALTGNDNVVLIVTGVVILVLLARGGVKLLTTAE